MGDGVIEGIKGVRLGSVVAVAVMAKVGEIPLQAAKRKRPMIYIVFRLIEIAFIINNLLTFSTRVFYYWWIRLILMTKIIG